MEGSFAQTKGKEQICSLNYTYPYINGAFARSEHLSVQYSTSEVDFENTPPPFFLMLRECDISL